MPNASGDRGGSVFERVARALLGLPQRRRLALRQTDAGIDVTLPALGTAVPVLPPPAVDARRFWIDADATPAEAVSTEESEATATPDPAAATLKARGDMTGDELAAIDAATDAIRDADRGLAEMSPETHAAALLERLQGEPETVGAVDFEVVSDVYADMLIELQWQPQRWGLVSQELRALTGGRKRYRNGRQGEPAKVLVFDIPDPEVDQIAEHFAESIAGEHDMREAA